MSAEFEKIVLEKFDELKTEIISLSKKVKNLDVKVDNLDAKVNNLDVKVNNLDVKVDNLDIKVNTIEQKVDQQGLNFAEFENEFNIKVQALFDSFVANTESHLAYDKFISALNAKTYDHNIRISVLEDYFKNAKLLSTN
jgi:hypothetical protein